MVDTLPALEADPRAPQHATPEDYAEHYTQLSVDPVGLAADVELLIPRRVRSYSPKFGTAGVSAALARLAGWTWGHRYVVRHVLDLMGGLSIEGLTDSRGRPLPVCRDTGDQIAEQLGMSPGTVRNALSKATQQGILGTASGTVRARGAGRIFRPCKARGPRVLYPGRVLVELLDSWAEVSSTSDTSVINQ